MKNEAEFKSVFKKSVRAQGGFSISLSAPMLSGIPDLYVIIPGFMPVLLEAKWLGSLGRKFKRKIQYSPLQRHFLDECNKIKVNSALGLIGFKWEDNIWASLKPRILQEENETISSDYINEYSATICTPYTGKTFNVVTLFAVAGVPRINGYASGKNNIFNINATSPLKQDGNSGLAT